ncbi:hypothetical protein GCM10027063_21280 [Promicromonospora xylanilytica]
MERRDTPFRVDRSSVVFSDMRLRSTPSGRPAGPSRRGWDQEGLGGVACEAVGCDAACDSGVTDVTKVDHIVVPSKDVGS